MTPPDPAVRDLYARLLEAWNAHDADRYGALFAPDAMVVGFDGSQASGAEAADHVRDVFDDHVTARYVAKVRQVR
ncbi:MAG TPA: SgcJ/EcaC family oxidoreductase, partial [Euzebyales bacterium]|nr:SgcJ/EcaC family oxidoreductase [Euzebyales bacterium]